MKKSSKHGCRWGCMIACCILLFPFFAAVILPETLFSRRITDPEVFSHGFLTPVSDDINISWFDFFGSVGGGIGLAEGHIVNDTLVSEFSKTSFVHNGHVFLRTDSTPLDLFPQYSEISYSSKDIEAFLHRENVRSFPDWINRVMYRNEWQMYSFSETNLLTNSSPRPQPPITRIFIQSSNPTHFVFWGVSF